MLGAKGEILATGDRVVVLDGRAEGFTLDDRAYRGRLHLTVDAVGRLAAVLALPL